MNYYAQALLRAAQDPLAPGDARELRYLQAFVSFLQQDECSLPGGDFSEEIEHFLIRREQHAPNLLITYSGGDLGERNRGNT